MHISESDKRELHKLQPELVVADRRIFGFFYLSASYAKQYANREIICHEWNHEDKCASYIRGCFEVEFELDNHLCPVNVREKSGIISVWKQEIRPAFLHLNGDDSLCLGVLTDMIKEQSQHSFAEFINVLLMAYFYYMCYAQKHNREPWPAYRHGLFRVLEALSSDNFNAETMQQRRREIVLSVYNNIAEWDMLLQKTQGNKIKFMRPCPFCEKDVRLAMDCEMHKKQIKGYNKLRKFISE